MSHATALPALDDRGRIPLHEYAALTFLARYSGGTRQNYSYGLRRFFGWCYEHDLDPMAATRRHLELYVRHCEHDLGNKPATVTNKVGILKGYYDFACEDDFIPKNPAARLTAPRYFADETLLVGLSPAELRALIQTACAGTACEEVTITLMAVLGLRISEVAALRIEDFTDNDRGHTVLRIVGKGRRAATIPLPPPVLRSMNRAAGGRTSGILVLRDSNGMPLTQKSACAMVRRLAKAAGITKKVHSHLLRHGMVTAALDAGVPLRDVQVAARHSDPRTTTRYDRARLNLDRHAAYVVSAYLTGGA